MKNKNISVHKDSLSKKNFFEKNINLFLFLLAVLSFLIFSPCLRNGFLIYDDMENVTGNVYITSLNTQHLKTFFTTPLLYMYTPLVYISFAIDYKISGWSPVIFHLTNVVLHLANILLVFVFIKLLSGKKETAFITAALFAVHPVMADTVAWISTRSNLLFTFFFLGSAISYLFYLENNSRLKFYFFSLLLFLFSSLSKSASIVLPFVLLLTDYFKGRKFSLKAAGEKIPFFIIAIAMAAITIYVRTDVYTSQTPFAYSLADKFFILCYSFFAYIIRVIFPFNLSAVYSYPSKPGGTLPAEFYVTTVIILVLLTIMIMRIRKARKEIYWGILFFLFTIVVSQVGFLEDGFTANRYAYLPYTGLFFIIGSFYSWIPGKKIFVFVLAVSLIVFSIASFYRAQVWQNSMTLFNDIINKQPDNAFAFNSRGVAKYEKQNYKGSVEDYSHAIELNKKYAEAFCNRAISHYALKNFLKSSGDYTKAIELNPKSAKSFLGRGIIKMDVLKDYDGAIRDYDKAVELSPFFPQAYFNRGLVKLRTDNVREACEDFKKVKQLGYSQADELIRKYCN